MTYDIITLSIHLVSGLKLDIFWGSVIHAVVGFWLVIKFS